MVVVPDDSRPVEELMVVLTVPSLERWLRCVVLRSLLVGLLWMPWSSTCGWELLP